VANECNEINYYHYIKPKTAPIRINLDRMKSALSAETFVMPQGLSREEKRKLILEAGKK
jgi:hypothetical protein